jgi:hypothetical protein
MLLCDPLANQPHAASLPGFDRDRTDCADGERYRRLAVARPAAARLADCGVSKLDMH